MRRTALVLAALALAGCSTSPRPAGSATLTLFGPEPRLESWKTSVVEGVHVHASEGEPCTLSSLVAAAAAATGKGVQADRFAEAAQGLCPPLLGPAYGGPDRTTVVFRSPANEALIVVLPGLKPDESDRLFRAGECSAAVERPLKTVEAVLDRGWVRAVRAPGGRTEFELFLVLKPVRSGASYESLQVITRVVAPAR